MEQMKTRGLSASLPDFSPVTSRIHFYAPQGRSRVSNQAAISSPTNTALELKALLATVLLSSLQSCVLEIAFELGLHSR